MPVCSAGIFWGQGGHASQGGQRLWGEPCWVKMWPVWRLNWQPSLRTAPKFSDPFCTFHFRHIPGTDP